MKIIVISDAWHPQINGVVRVLEMTRRELSALGHQVILKRGANTLNLLGFHY